MKLPRRRSANNVGSQYDMAIMDAVDHLERHSRDESVPFPPRFGAERIYYRVWTLRHRNNQILRPYKVAIRDKKAYLVRGNSGY